MADKEESMVGALSQLAYGHGSTPAEMMQSALSALTPTPEQESKDALLNWAGNLTDPSGSGRTGGALTAAAKGEANWRLEQQKLKAQYIPLIMQSIAQQQNLTLQAANASREYLKDINPRLDSHMAALLTNNNQPTYEQAVHRLLQLGQEYQVPPQVLMPKLQSIPRDPAELQSYLYRLATGTAGAEKMIPTAAVNAAGQQVGVSPAMGTMSVLGAPRGSQGAPGAPSPGVGGTPNPTKPQVLFEESATGDIKDYEKGLRDRADTYKNMLARMNEQSEYIKNFQPGRYAGAVGGFAAAVKDVGTRLPGVDKSVVEDLTRRLLGAQGTEEALAAQQTFEQLAQQETLAQLRSSLGENQRMNQAEYRNFANVNLGQRMDPETFNNLRKFFYSQAADAANKYGAWADYVSDEGVPKKSVTGFDARYTKGELGHYLSGKPGPVHPERPGSVLPSYPAPQKPAPAAAATGATAGPQVDLAQYETGARVGPTGKVYVLDKGSPRPARKLEEGGLRRISNREVAGKVTNE